LRILVTLEEHLWRARDGHIYTHGPACYSDWTELLRTFDEVLLLSRVASRNESAAGHEPVDGPFISVHALPNYTGPWEYLRKLASLRREVRDAAAKCDVFLLRVPGLVGRLAWHELRRANRAYAAHVVADPSDVLSSGATRSFFRPVYRQVATTNLREICKHANSVLYCTAKSLQRHYPAANAGYTAQSPWIILPQGYASAELMLQRQQRIDSAISSNGHKARPFRLGFMGSFAQLYKGADTLLRAGLICSQNGLDFEIFFAGEGRYRRAMQSLATELSIQEKVFFLGQLTFGKLVFDFLDSLDLFLMPSRAEAFGRALLEAMARGCPCIGSDVGGIPELLASQDLVPPSDPEALAQKIMEVTSDPARMNGMSERNLARAKQFDPEVLRETRLAFYRYLRDHLRSNAKSRTERQSKLQPL
jgi:glycosyltransferase involved in cell wall biosynthesis